MKILSERESDGGVQLTGAALGAQGSQRFINRFFARHVKGGASLSSLRPVIQSLAADDVMRPADALTFLWNVANKRRRNEYLDEIFKITAAPKKLADWGKTNPRAFSSPQSLSHLRKLPPRSLETIFRRIIASDDDSGAGSLQATAAVLKVAGDREEYESIVVQALRRGSPQVRNKALMTVNVCSSPEMLEQLAGIVESENETVKPDLERVHLALSALVKSRLPHAKNWLRRFRSERRFLRHMYRREIREILDLLCKLSGVSL